MDIFLAWIAFSVLAGIIGHSKGRSGLGLFFVSLVLSPIIGLIAAIAMPALGDPRPVSGLQPDAERVKCPHCAEQILREAKVCKHCGRDVEPQVVQTTTPPPQPADDAWARGIYKQD